MKSAGKVVTSLHSGKSRVFGDPLDRCSLKMLLNRGTGKLTRVNQLGRPENRPERQGDHAVVRNEMKRVFALIDGVATERSSQSER